MFMGCAFLKTGHKKSLCTDLGFYKGTKMTKHKTQLQDHTCYSKGPKNKLGDASNESQFLNFLQALAQIHNYIVQYAINYAGDRIILKKATKTIMTQMTYNCCCNEIGIKKMGRA